MPFIRNKPLELEFDNNGKLVALRGETNKGKKGFLGQMELLNDTR